MKMIKRSALLAAACAVTLLSGCATEGHDVRQPDQGPPLSAADKAHYITRADKRAALNALMVKKQLYRQAYEQGVRDTMNDFKGRLEAMKGFVWEPPVIEYVQMPAAVVDGALIPTHRTPVILTPGRWVERNGIELPKSALNNSPNSESSNGQ